MRVLKVAALFALAGCATVPTEPEYPTIEVQDDAGRLDQQANEALSREAAASALMITKTVGGSAATLIRLVVDPARRVPYTEDAGPNGEVVIRLPAGRINPANIADSPLALHHEMTHAIAPGRRPEGRLLVEGLAVYMDDRLGGNNYPDFERSPHQTVRMLEERLKYSIPLGESEAARLEHESGDARQLAYAQEGSFVAWLIETRGLSGFLTFYNSEASYEQGLGKSLRDLEKDWRQWLAQLEQKDSAATK